MILEGMEYLLMIGRTTSMREKNRRENLKEKSFKKRNQKNRERNNGKRRRKGNIRCLVMGQSYIFQSEEIKFLMIDGQKNPKDCMINGETPKYWPSIKEKQQIKNGRRKEDINITLRNDNDSTSIDMLLIQLQIFIIQPRRRWEPAANNTPNNNQNRPLRQPSPLKTTSPKLITSIKTEISTKLFSTIARSLKPTPKAGQPTITSDLSSLKRVKPRKPSLINAKQ